MKKIFLLLLMLPAMLLAAPVDPNLAQQVAENFINAPEVDANGVLRAPKKRKQMARALRQITNDQQFYVFNSQDGEGFVIVSADDVAHPILGYSQSENLDIETIPDNLRWWLSEYDRQIRWAQDNNIEQSKEIAQEWQQVCINKIKAATPVVGPLIQTKWDQRAPYNNLCPIYNGTDRAATGCVATATAQIMNYWQYPLHGIGSCSYTTPTHQFQLSANFSNSTYDWQNMHNTYSYCDAAGNYHEYSRTTAQKNAVAKLMSDVGIACEMDYAKEGYESASDNIYAARALVLYFNYDWSTYIISRDSFDLVPWRLLMQQQLDRNQPVLYQGKGGNAQNTGGHSFVCDGYNSDGMFHLNWGWSGTDDGYFNLSSLIPKTGGTGDNVKNYSYNQQSVVDIKPSTSTGSHNLQLLYGIKTSKSSLSYGNAFTISVNIYNVGDADFNGTLYAVMGDRNGNIAFLDSLNNALLSPMPAIALAYGAACPTITFENDGKLDLDTGMCTIAIFYEDENGNFAQVGSDYSINGLQIEYYRDFQLTPGKYVIVANRDKDGDRNWYYMTSDLGTASTKRFQAVSTGTESMSEIAISDLEDKYVWTLEADGDNWKLKNGTQYITWTTGNSANLGSTGKSLTFEIAENQVQAHFNDGTAERYLSLNATTNNNYFAFYGNTNQITYLYFLPYEEEEPPVIPQPESDRYVVLAQRNASSNWFYMTSDLGTASNKRYQAVDAGTSTLSAVVTTNLDDKYYWEFEENKLKTGTQYSTWVSGNTANLDDTGKELTIQQQTDGTYTFSFADGTDTRYLALNATAGNNYFAYYKGTNQIYRLTLVKEGENGSTVGVENLVEQPIVTKILRDGQILILRGDKTYTLTGQEVR